MKIELNRVQHISTVFPGRSAANPSCAALLGGHLRPEASRSSEFHRQTFINWSAVTNQEAIYEGGVYLLVWACGIATVWVAFTQPFHG